MNYAPEVTPLGPGRWRAEGLMFHMLSEVSFSKEETAKILQHGPWPPPPGRDPSNRVSGKPEAIALGEKLFFEPRLSGTGSVLCATCHA
ncbi:MAG: cytochrome c peroxidase, partial [Burkholderiales bacterium]